MKSLRHSNRFFGECRWLLALLSVFLAPALWATIPLYSNEGNSIYTIPGTPPPQIDAVAFLNDSDDTFQINFDTYEPGTPFYETLNTLFYTNNGTIIVNGPITTNDFASLLLLEDDEFGCGFQFDQQTLSQHLWADTFYNPGTIRCGSSLDGNDFYTSLSLESYLLRTYYIPNVIGECLVSATNIIDPGTIEVGSYGAVNLTGWNVDVSQGQLIQDPVLSLTAQSGEAPFAGYGATGVNTNVLWNPAGALAPPDASSSYVPGLPYDQNSIYYSFLVLTNCVSYATADKIGTNTVVYRYVFIQNDSTNMPVQVYFDPIDQYNPNFFNDVYVIEPGEVHVQWTGSYIDAGSGAPVTSYLYLTDAYLYGANTNNFVYNGLPINFDFTQSATPVQMLAGPAAQAFYGVAPDSYMTNNYAAFDGEMSAATVRTNASYANPHGTITNLPGKVRISAGNELNLAFTRITGLNYLNLNCTNQFDGSPGAFIASPYSDISLGVTNGFLVVSNVLVANLPNWGGPIKAWSSVWDDYTTTPGITNEFRVLVVHSDLGATAVPWIQNLFLHGTTTHGTNTLSVSDHLNVYGSFYSDAKVLVLQTNLTGQGATALDGEINYINPATFNANSGSGVQQLPNLLSLTNYGMLKVANNANFGNASILGVPAVPATGTLLLVGTNPVINDRVTIASSAGINQYVFVATLANNISNQVAWATNGATSMNNLIAAINGAAGAGSLYSSKTLANPVVTAGPLANNAFTVTARVGGSDGNAIQTLFAPANAQVANLRWTWGTNLVHGVAAMPPLANVSFNNLSLVADLGTTIWTGYFENGGKIDNGNGNFALHAGSAFITNGSILAGGDVLLAATNNAGLDGNTMVISNGLISAGLKLTLWTTNLAGDCPTNNNIFSVGANSGGGPSDSGFNIYVKPIVGNLLGTTVTNIAPFNKTIYNVWAGQDFGLSPAGYTNNLAIGHLVLNSYTTNQTGPVAFSFSGPDPTNPYALYVDLLELKNGATGGDLTNNYNFPWLKLSTNMTLYFAQAIENGKSVAEAIDDQSKLGANSGRLRWVYSYAGYYSSTNLYSTNSVGLVTTNTVNTPLAQSSHVDSDADGIPNLTDPTPFFEPTELHFGALVTTFPAPGVRVEWTTIPNATNFLFYTTNLMGLAPTNWVQLTNYSSTNWYFGNRARWSNAPVSPQVYIDNPNLGDNSQQTNVWLYDVVTNVPRYYRVVVWPDVDFEP